MNWGRFIGTPKLDHINDREAILLAPFTFVRRNGELWTAPSPMRFDGTSIPWYLWTAFRESPFTGRAFYSAVIHDAGCKGIVLVDGVRRQQAGRRDGQVHQTFYEGCRAYGMGASKAWGFYRSVWAINMTKGGKSPHAPIEGQSSDDAVLGV